MFHVYATGVGRSFATFGLLTKIRLSQETDCQAGSEARNCAVWGGNLCMYDVCNAYECNYCNRNIGARVLAVRVEDAESELEGDRAIVLGD